MNKSLIHGVAGATAMLTIAAFWSSTLISELFLGHSAVVVVKHAIVTYGLGLLVAAMATTGASGFALAKSRKGRLVESKKRRMPFIALNGLLIMIPSALFLNHQATAGTFDTWFYIVQALELTVGLVQLTLMTLSFRDGLRLTGKGVVLGFRGTSRKKSSSASCQSKASHRLDAPKNEEPSPLSAEEIEHRLAQYRGPMEPDDLRALVRRR